MDARHSAEQLEWPQVRDWEAAKEMRQQRCEGNALQQSSQLHHSCHVAETYRVERACSLHWEIEAALGALELGRQTVKCAALANEEKRELYNSRLKEQRHAVGGEAAAARASD
jgi:hypothetical protein